MQIILRSNLQFTSDLSIDQFVDPTTIDSLKKQDKHPLIKLYAVAHEGESKPRVIGKGSLIIKWFKDSIQKVYNKINLGIQCIKGHTKDNNLRDEKVLGTIIGKGIREINNKLYSIVAVHFNNKHDSDYDIISMESDVVTEQDANEIKAVDVVEIKRFALGKSISESPAFSGAKELLTVQMFEHEIQSENENEKTTKKSIGGNPKSMSNQLTFHDVQRAVKDLNIHPTQLYSIEDIVGNVEKKENGNITFYGGDHKVIAFLNKQVPDTTSYLSKLEESNKRISELEKIEKDYKETQKRLAIENIKSNLDKKLTERSLDDKRKQFVKKAFEKFSPSEVNEEIVDKFIGEQLETYKDFYQIFSGGQSEEISQPDVKPIKEEEFSKEMF